MSEVIGEPTPDEVVQSEYSDLPKTVPVTVETPVRVQELPATMWGVELAFPTDGVGAQKLLSRNPKRKRAIITSLAGGIYIAPTQQQAQSRQGFRVGLDAKIVITHQESVWVFNEAGETPYVSAMCEYWTN